MCLESSPAPPRLCSLSAYRQESWICWRSHLWSSAWSTRSHWEKPCSRKTGKSQNRLAGPRPHTASHHWRASCVVGVWVETAPAQTNRACIKPSAVPPQVVPVPLLASTATSSVSQHRRAPSRWPPPSRGTQASLPLGLQDCLQKGTPQPQVWAPTGHTQCDHGAAPSKNRSTENNVQSTRSLHWGLLKCGRVRVRVQGSRLEACSVFCQVTLEKSLNFLPLE